MPRRARRWSVAPLAEIAVAAQANFNAAYEEYGYLSVRRAFDAAGIPYPATARHREATTKLKPKWRHLLGTRPDSQIAAQVGVSPVTVQAHRRRLGIPAFRALHDAPIRAALAALPNDAFREKDAALAARLGCGKTTVTAERRSRGIVRGDPLARRDTATHAAVRGMFAAGCTGPEMARVLHVSRQRVYQLLVVVRAEGVGAARAATAEPCDP